MEIKKVEFGGWPNCLSLRSGNLELIVTTDVGPRIISMTIGGSPNQYAVWKDQLGRTGGDEWNIFGGHRFWLAPETKPRTYHLDNFPVEVIQPSEGVVIFRNEIEKSTGIQKEVEIRLGAPASASSPSTFTIVHRMINCNAWTVKDIAPWSLSVMAEGGFAFFPLPPRGPHGGVDGNQLGNSSTLSLWNYTDFTDKRWLWGKRFIALRQDPTVEREMDCQKIGALCPEASSWAAYANGSVLSVCSFKGAEAGKSYPDGGCNLEIFTNKPMLEVETLGPLCELMPGSVSELVENWSIMATGRSLSLEEGEAGLERDIVPLVHQCLSIMSA